MLIDRLHHRHSARHGRWDLSRRSSVGAGIADVVRFLVDTLTGLPTIVFGLFIWVLIVAPTHTFSGLAGGLALSIIMVPTVARATEEVLRLVPGSLREASVGAGWNGIAHDPAASSFQPRAAASSLASCWRWRASRVRPRPC